MHDFESGSCHWNNGHLLSGVVRVGLHHEDNGEYPIDTWEDMKNEMRSKFVPPHAQDLFTKLHELKQGTSTGDEY